MSKKNLESTELRQDTTLKQTEALETRIKYFQEQQASQVPGKLLDLAAKTIISAANAGKKIKKIFPEDTYKKILDLYQKLMLSF
jgi:hypothetical protein